MVESISSVGTLNPVLARPMPDGGYEIISGHRRVEACRMLGIDTIPVVVREMTDDEAVIAMVDANLQREQILPSEKAFAYKMKLEALSRQGKRTDLTSSQVATKLDSATAIGSKSGESRDTVFRFVRLTHLVPELLQMVDDKRIAFTPAVELSYLTELEQTILLDAINLIDCTPSHAQSIRLKRLSQEGILDSDTIYRIMSEHKPNQLEHIRLRWDDFRKYFPSDCTDEQIKSDIIKGLELLRRQQSRNNGSR